MAVITPLWELYRFEQGNPWFSAPILSILCQTFSLSSSVGGSRATCWCCVVRAWSSCFMTLLYSVREVLSLVINALCIRGCGDADFIIAGCSLKCCNVQSIDVRSCCLAPVYFHTRWAQFRHLFRLSCWPRYYTVRRWQVIRCIHFIYQLWRAALYSSEFVSLYCCKDPLRCCFCLRSPVLSVLLLWGADTLPAYGLLSTASLPDAWAPVPDIGCLHSGFSAVVCIRCGQPL